METTPTTTPALYSKTLKANGKVYFFDVRAAKNGHKYLSLSESWIKDGQKHRGNITVFSDKLDEFNQAFAETQEQMK